MQAPKGLKPASQ